jgi:hypothetical protein
MAGINDRVQGFLDSWAIVEKHLNEILEEAIRNGNKGLVELKGGLQAFEDILTDTLQAVEGKIPAASTSLERDVAVSTG